MMQRVPRLAEFAIVCHYLIYVALLDDLAFMHHVELFGGILACSKHDGLPSTRMRSGEQYFITSSQ